MTHPPAQANYPILAPICTHPAARGAPVNSRCAKALSTEAGHNRESSCPTQSTELLHQGIAHWRTGNTPEAIRSLKAVLLRQPYQVEAMHFLALAYHRQGRSTQAQALLRQAMTLAPDYHPAHANLGRILTDCRRYDEAITTLEGLLQRSPHDHNAWAALGRALTLRGDTETAARACARSVKLNPRTASTQLAYGHALKTLGDWRQARLAYRAAAALEPQLGEAYWSIANLKCARFDDAEVVVMNKLLNDKGLAEQRRIHLHFALGKAFEERREFDLAWHHVHWGNQLKRRRVTYRPQRHAALVEQTKAYFQPGLFSAERPQGCDTKSPIFIVGLPRSGSTLIEQILASHSQVEGTAELPYLSSLAQRARSAVSRRQHNKIQLGAADLKALGEHYLLEADRHRRLGTPFFVDKMPNNYLHIGWIKQVFPNAKIINARRHPLDNCLAAYKQLFARGQHFTYDPMELAHYYCAYSDLMKHWQTLLPGQVLDMHYELTVLDLEAQVRKLLVFCGLPFEENCLRFYETQRAVRSASASQVRQPIYSDAMGLWRHYAQATELWRFPLEPHIKALPAQVKAAAGGPLPGAHPQAHREE